MQHIQQEFRTAAFVAPSEDSPAGDGGVEVSSVTLMVAEFVIKSLEWLYPFYYCDLELHSYLERFGELELIARLEDHKKRTVRNASCQPLHVTPRHPENPLDRPHNPTQPYAATNDLRVNDLNEAQLEEICRQNWVPYKDDFRGRERRATTTAEFDLKQKDLTKKRNEAIERANIKYNKEIDAARKGKERKLDDLEEELGPYLAKSRNWDQLFINFRGQTAYPNEFRPQSSGANTSPLNERRPYETASLASRSSRAISSSAMSTSTTITNSTTTGTKRSASLANLSTFNDPPSTRPRFSVSISSSPASTDIIESIPIRP
ncbi:hypothetical protein B0J14DRAFT_661676 [Halenospora varia]|nr:hypothetical protein B0J14DRAFT_661676 [Halenospora varia]